MNLNLDVLYVFHRTVVIPRMTIFLKYMLKEKGEEKCLPLFLTESVKPLGFNLLVLHFQILPTQPVDKTKLSIMLAAVKL